MNELRLKPKPREILVSSYRLTRQFMVRRVGFETGRVWYLCYIDTADYGILNWISVANRATCSGVEEVLRL